MKKLFALLLALTVTAVFAGDENKDAHAAHKGEKGQKIACELNEDEAHTSIKISTARCQNCVSTIEKAVKKVDGVSSVQVDLDKKITHVHYQEEKTSVEKLEQAIAEAGYDANDVKRNEKAHDNLPACCQLER